MPHRAAMPAVGEQARKPVEKDSRAREETGPPGDLSRRGETRI